MRCPRCSGMLARGVTPDELDCVNCGHTEYQAIVPDAQAALELGTGWGKRQPRMSYRKERRIGGRVLE